jgi:hypothetical protein
MVNISIEQRVKERWFRRERKRFRLIISYYDKEDCCICNKHNPITESHHLTPLHLQYKYRVVEVDHSFVWLCPNHHRLVHRAIVDYANALKTNDECILQIVEIAAKNKL